MGEKVGEGWGNTERHRAEGINASYRRLGLHGCLGLYRRLALLRCSHGCTLQFDLRKMAPRLVGVGVHRPRSRRRANISIVDTRRIYPLRNGNLS